MTPINRLTAFRREYLGPQVNPRTTTHWLTGWHDKQILDSYSTLRAVGQLGIAGRVFRSAYLRPQVNSRTTTHW